MQEAVKIMYRIQSLEIILEETRIVHRDNLPPQYATLQETIEALRNQVPEEHLARYDRIRKNGQAVVNLVNGFCLGCRMEISLGDLNRMKRDEANLICPHCGKFLLLV
ncbi:MAG: hypothetical protein GX561_07940 [Lentisphaerae bacterium]|jgi:predicted  nucleic acid-binding Zn-ribbon protein|nr:hypothetical protein [Lentisphaerota bacterium]